MWNQSYMWVLFKLSISCDCLETINYFSNNQVIWSHLEMPGFPVQVLLPLIGKILVAHQLTICLLQLSSQNSQGSFAKFTACFNLTPALSLPHSPLLASVFWPNKVLQTGYQGADSPSPPPPLPQRSCPKLSTRCRPQESWIQASMGWRLRVWTGQNLCMRFLWGLILPSSSLVGNWGHLCTVLLAQALIDLHCCSWTPTCPTHLTRASY